MEELDFGLSEEDEIDDAGNRMDINHQLMCRMNTLYVQSIKDVQEQKKQKKLREEQKSDELDLKLKLQEKEEKEIDLQLQNISQQQNLDERDEHRILQMLEKKGKEEQIERQKAQNREKAKERRQQREALKLGSNKAAMPRAQNRLPMKRRVSHMPQRAAPKTPEFVDPSSSSGSDSETEKAGVPKRPTRAQPLSKVVSDAGSTKAAKERQVKNKPYSYVSVILIVTVANYVK